MTQVVKETRVVEQNPQTVNTLSAGNSIARLIYTISGIINGLLAMRFALALLGANPANAFANLIYQITRPLVAPFFGLFNYDTQYGIARFEFETLIAMAVYSLVAWVLVRIFAQDRSTVE